MHADSALSHLLRLGPFVVTSFLFEDLYIELFCIVIIGCLFSYSRFVS
jgi:hypothetical protein